MKRTLEALAYFWLFVVLGLVIAGVGESKDGRRFIAAVVVALIDVAAVVALGIWFFPRAAQKLESPILGFFVGLPIFALLAAAIVLFLGTTCYGIIIALN